MSSPLRQQGLSLVELMVAMAISLVIVIAAAYVYLASREGQRSLDRMSGSREVGTFVLQTLGRDLMNAGFYPATVLPIAAHRSQTGMYDSYYPFQNTPRVDTDWENRIANWPPAAFQAGIFGCDSAQFESATSACATTVTGAADTLVINYFTNDTAAAPGTRLDCTGADVDNDHSNAERKKNAGNDPALAPGQPLFVSNRYTLVGTKLYVDKGDISTKSLACSGNGTNWHGQTAAYQPMIAGVEDLQFTYGLYNAYDPTSPNNSLAPAQFLTSSEMASASTLTVNGISLTPWQRVTAVRVCLLTRTMGGNTRLADKAGSEATYTDCSGTSRKQPAGYLVTRYEQIFGVRNALRLSY